MHYSMNVNSLHNLAVKFFKLAGAIKTPEELAQFIKSFLSGMNVELNVYEDTVEATITDYLEVFDAAERFSKLEKEIEAYGWYITNFDSLEYPTDELLLYFHKIITMEVPIPKYVYHMTRKSGLISIMRHGIKLTTGGERHVFRYPPRVFVSRMPEVLEGMDLGIVPSSNVAILKIDTDKIPGVKLFLDPQFPVEDIDNWVSAFTTIPIPPEAIEIM
jgi:hypothetical protein